MTSDIRRAAAAEPHHRAVAKRASGAGPAGVVHVVLPGDVDDPRTPSGGNRYDREACRGLVDLGWVVREHAMPGSWPRPDRAARAGLGTLLAHLPDAAPVLLDGLVACGVPDLLGPHSGRLRLVVLVHLPLADETGLSPRRAAELDDAERHALHAATAVVATSDWAARRLVEHHGLHPTVVRVAPPGVDAAPLAHGTDGGSRLLCVASVTARKGQDVLVQALSTLDDLPWNCRCVGAVGQDAEYHHRLRRLIASRRLDSRLELVGSRAGDELAAEYANADLLVLPSRMETYGMVITEALARGIAVLATDVAGVPEALGRAPGGALPGMLVPPEHPAALANALRRWLTEPDLRHTLTRAARARRRTLPGWPSTAHRLAETLTAICDGAGPARSA